MAKAKTMRVKLLQGAAGPLWTARAGDSVWLEAGEAQQLVDGGYAELLQEEAAEAQEAGVVELAAPVVEEATAPIEAVAETATGARERTVAVKRPAAKKE